MSRPRRFCDADLHSIISSVLDRLGENFDVYINSGEGLAVLANVLDIITSNLDDSANFDAMAKIMAMVASKVNRDAPIAYKPVRGRKMDALMWEIRTEISIECAVYFAQKYGYRITAAQVPHDQVARILLVEDCWEGLIRLFENALARASFDTGPHMAEDIPGQRGLSSLTQIFEGESALDRKLSTESYSNLRSEAYRQKWSETEILTLIEEHLRPRLSPFAVHYSDTVSGEEWLTLYNWLRRQDGQRLCCRLQLSQK
jgi:hypothetical protein